MPVVFLIDAEGRIVARTDGWRDERDPPLLLLHGDQDPQMPVNQSHELQGRYEKLGLPVHFEVVHGAAHGGKLFYEEERIRKVTEFLNKHIRTQ